MADSLKSLNQKQLVELITRAEQRKLEMDREHVAIVREKVHAILKAEGLGLQEVFGNIRKTRRRATPR